MLDLIPKPRLRTSCIELLEFGWFVHRMWVAFSCSNSNREFEMQNTKYKRRGWHQWWKAVDLPKSRIILHFCPLLLLLHQCSTNTGLLGQILYQTQPVFIRYVPLYIEVFCWSTFSTKNVNTRPFKMFIHPCLVTDYQAPNVPWPRDVVQSPPLNHTHRHRSAQSALCTVKLMAQCKVHSEVHNMHRMHTFKKRQYSI